MTNLSDLLGGSGSSGRSQFQAIEQHVVKQTVNSSTVTIDCEAANFHELLLQSNVSSLLFSNLFNSGKLGKIVLIIYQDGSGSRTISWPGSINWASGTNPTLSTSANAVDVIVLTTDDAGISWDGLKFGQ